MQRESSQQRIELADEVAEMYQDYDEIESQYRNLTRGRYEFDPVREEMRRDVLELESKGIGQSWPIPFSQGLLDAVRKVELEKSEHGLGLISPDEVCRGESRILTLAGMGLEDVEKVNIAGQDAVVIHENKPGTQEALKPGTLKVFVENLQFTGSGKKQADVVEAEAKLTQAKLAAGKIEKDGETQLKNADAALLAVFKPITDKSDEIDAAKKSAQDALTAGSKAQEALDSAGDVLAAALAGPARSVDASKMKDALDAVEDAHAKFSAAVAAVLKIVHVPLEAYEAGLGAARQLAGLEDYLTKSRKTLTALDEASKADDASHAALGSTPADGGLPVILTLGNGQSLPPVTDLLHVRKTPCPKMPGAEASKEPLGDKIISDEMDPLDLPVQQANATIEVTSEGGPLPTP